jgi:Cof subfamily protein (haloacid dehalogenase superfamily)
MIARAYDAILLDIDGTLLDEGDRIHPHTRKCLNAAVEVGAQVMLVTGRSEQATLPVLIDLGLSTPAVVYNGAAVYCGVERRFLEARTLSNRTRDRAIAFGLQNECTVVSMCAGAKYALEPRDPLVRMALRDMTSLQFVGPEQLYADRALRITLFSDRHRDSAAFAAEVESAVDQPVYISHFPLRLLPHHRNSELLVVDVHAPCRGKGEALRVLEERFGIPPSRAVAVGDADNDLGMIREAGLGVVMEAACGEVRAAAGRVIGGNNTDAIGRLVEELFLSPSLG